MSDVYKNSGVDIHKGYEVVRRIKKDTDRTKIPGVMGSIGSFGGLFDLSGLGYKEPVLVSGTDGVGTKLLLAILLNKHDTVGIDLVAMSVNDVLAQGAKPLFFLDYVAVGKNDPVQIAEIVKGVADGCVLSGCALIGGETAEMPGMYENGHYDLAGFAVGIAEKAKLITNEKTREGDVIIGLKSSGLHSNGFSLVRKLVLKDHGLDLNAYVPELNGTLGEALLKPTRIYVKSVLTLLEQVEVHSMAHITGGGFIENIPRSLNSGLQAEIYTDSYDIPPLFTFLKKLGNIPDEEIYNVFNMGIGFTLTVSPDDVQKAISVLKANGEEAVVIGRVVKGEGVALL